LQAHLQEVPLATIDYEAEYNNRARVPEHPEIFARWARDAESYRIDTLKNGRAAGGARSIRRCTATSRAAPMRAASRSP
jgi:hypothetical protein